MNSCTSKHENVLPAVVNTGAAIAKASQPGISVQSCHVCHFVSTRLRARAPAVCHLQSGVCSCCLPYLLQLVKSLCCVAMWSVWTLSTDEWSLIHCNWKYLRASGDTIIISLMVISASVCSKDMLLMLTLFIVYIFCWQMSVLAYVTFVALLIFLLSFLTNLLEYCQR